MSLIFAEGFENYGTSGRPNFYKYSANTNAIYNSLTTGRFHGYAWRMGATWVGPAYDIITTHHIAPNGNTTMYLGMAVRKRSTSGMTSGYSRRFITFFDHNDAAQASMYFNSSNEATIETYTGQAISLKDSGTFITDTAWHYIEYGVHINATTGWHEIRLDGVEICRFDGNTDYTGAGDITKVQVYSPFNYATYAIDIDDWYINDGNGSVNNDFIGNITVEALIPTSDGNETDFTPSTGSDHYAVVDEVPPNSSDYITADTAGRRDTFGCSNLSYINREVKGVYVEYACKNEGIADNEMRSVTRVNGTTYDGATTGLTVPIGQATYRTIGQSFDENPDTSNAWSVSEVNAAEFGVKLQG